MTGLKVFVGWDSKETAAFHVAVESLVSRASRPVSVTALVQSTLRSCGLYTRERKQNEATEFSLTRFLVPHLSGYEGYSLFLDCDVLVQADVWDFLLYPLIEPGKAVYCCQHDYVPKALTKFDGHEQAKYPRKNWSSVMLFDNAQCQALTPAYVNSATGLQLHRFHWLTDDQIGSLPLDLNHLVGEYDSNPDAKILHFTNGGCWNSAEYATGPEADRWRRCFELMTGTSASVQEGALSV